MASNNHPLKIAVLVRHYVLTGGAERYAVEITQRLIQRGCVVDLFCREYDAILIDGVNRIINVPKCASTSGVRGSVSFAKDTAKLLKNHPYDIIHSHERGYAQDVLTLHTFTWKNGLYDFALLKRIFRFYVTPRHYWYSWLERKQMQTRCLVAVSTIIATDVSKNYPQANTPQIISPGVDSDFFTPDYIHSHRDALRQEKNISPQTQVALFVGNEFKRKGLDDLIPALLDDMVLLVVGTGERHAYYHQLVQNAGVSDQVHFLGSLKDMRPLYAMSDVVVLPSHREAFGMVVLEAMACGLPVVVRNTVGAADLVNHGVNGYHFADANELKSVFKTLHDSQLRQTIAKNARQTAEANTWEHIVEHYLTCFSKISASR